MVILNAALILSTFGFSKALYWLSTDLSLNKRLELLKEFRNLILLQIIFILMILFGVSISDEHFNSAHYAITSFLFGAYVLASINGLFYSMHEIKKMNAVKITMELKDFNTNEKIVTVLEKENEL